MSKITISLTGHRPTKLAGYNLNKDYYKRLQAKLESVIDQTLEKHDEVELHSGMALGADTVWAMAIIEAKKKYPGRVTFVADIPDYNQSSLWPPYSQQQWKQLLDEADVVNTYSQDFEEKSYAYILNQRNIGMINPCDILIAVYNGDNTGGTANAVKYAVQHEKLIYRIHPETI